VANDRSAEIYVVELCDRMWPTAVVRKAEVGTGFDLS